MMYDDDDDDDDDDKDCVGKMMWADVLWKKPFAGTFRKNGDVQIVTKCRCEETHIWICTDVKR